MKTTKTEKATIILSFIAAVLCGMGSPFSAPTFVISSAIGLTQSIRQKLFSPTCINLIFLSLNLFCTVKNFLF